MKRACPALANDVDLLVDVRTEEQQRVDCRPGRRSCRCRRPGPTGTGRRRRPSERRSLPLSPKTKSLPSPPRIVSAPWLPRMVSSPAPPSSVSFMTPAGRVVAVMPSLPPLPLITSESLAPSAFVMFRLSRQAENRHGGARAEDIDDVVAVGPVLGHDVRRRVARGAADRARKIDVDLGHVGAG